MAKKKNEWLGFYKEFKLHKACANDDIRPAMHYVCFKNGYAYATDAHIAVRANLHDISALSDDDIAKLNGHLIHKSQYEQLLKYSSIEIGDGTITLIDPESKARTTIQLFKLAESAEEEEESTRTWTQSLTATNRKNSSSKYASTSCCSTRLPLHWASHPG